MTGQGRRRAWVVVASALAVAGAVFLAVLWNSTAPPDPAEILDGLRQRHGLELGRDKAAHERTYDFIALEWGSCAAALRDPSPRNEWTTVILRGWECGVRRATEVPDGALVLGSGTYAFVSGSTLSGRNPDGTFECKIGSSIDEGPTTVLLIAVPLGALERFRYGAR